METLLVSGFGVNRRKGGREVVCRAPIVNLVINRC
jgi:hypothetical protein